MDGMIYMEKIGGKIYNEIKYNEKKWMELYLRKKVDEIIYVE